MSGKAIRETLAALGVIASLVFVGMEIRQNNTVARMSAYQAFTQQLIDQSMLVIAGEYPALNARMTRGESREEFTLEETLHIDMVYMGLLRTWESLYRAVQLGVLDEEMLAIIDSNVGPFRFAYFQESWSDFRTTFTEDFATFFENLMVG